MIISTCGFGSTGSSAVSDYLLECSIIKVFDGFEFNLVHMEDGLEDLEYHIMNGTRSFSSIAAIERFKKSYLMFVHYWSANSGATKQSFIKILDEFLSSITQVSFVGDKPLVLMNSFERFLGVSIINQRLIRFLEKRGLMKQNCNYYPLSKVSISCRPSNFDQAAKKFVHDFLSVIGCVDDEYLVLDQAFTGNNPQKSFKFFDNPYAIVVDRDPRDQYIFAKKFLLSRGRYIPTDTVDNFITYYRCLRDNQPYKKENERVLRISFEEMVYNYDEAANKIDSFLGIKNNSRKTIFIPEISAANTNLIRKFPEFQSDISQIEQRLPEYLFPFENYKEISTDHEMFMGKSPLNKG